MSKVRAGYWVVGVAVGACLAPACSGKVDTVASDSGGTGGAAVAGAPSAGTGNIAHAGAPENGGNGSGGAPDSDSLAGAGLGGAPSAGSGGFGQGVSGSAGSAGSAGKGGIAGHPGGNDPCVPGSTKDPMTGLCVCHPSTDAICSQGCFDTTLDADHCGSCTNACAATQACRTSKCGPTPKEIVAPNAGCGVIRLALGGSTLYWTDEGHGKVFSLSTANNAVTAVATGQPTPSLLAAGNGGLYWVNRGNKTIMKAGSATPLVTGKAAIGGITLSADGKLLYYSDGFTVNVISTSTTDAKSTLIGKEDTGIPHALAVENDVVVFPTEINGDIEAMKITGAGDAVCASEDSMTAVNKNCVRLSRSQVPNVELVFLLGGKAYWTNQSALVAHGLDALATDTVASANGDAQLLTALAISGGAAFFASDDGFIYTSALTVGSTPAALARTVAPGATSIAVDSTNVYYATPGCSIDSVPIPK